ncbi:C40 family peptidase [Alicyclobacillus cycloheptanicus]|uniref:Cell wall-associated NlpC family hydrolase n=1 Tax=Alicyclobacillus cycloheptanicus TaxID=1457 RepID=A0ABT9XHZ9_9BACL|nr:C40 family peptidase [Alicyclobacillus cycloheptanicus]MDQ0189926.1 cell wall-associated NlpC family hydrolase [Alicyclobacillus cycloheptanicus]
MNSNASNTQGANTQTANTSQSGAIASAAAYQIKSTTYEPKSGTVTIHVVPSQGQSHPDRDLIDVGTNEGAVNYATSKFSTKTVRRVVLTSDDASSTASAAALRTSTARPIYRIISVPAATAAPNTASPSLPPLSTFSGGADTPLPPPGARMDTSMTPVAGLNAARTAKTKAVLGVARTKLGTPYIWGHNEDRGQYGFDCSNFTEYVYHHALGYIITTYSTGQYKSVGVPIPRSQMQPGDLIAFEQGQHVGIYAGNNQAIQCGGGLKKVGYISVKPGTYWGNHISAVKRMY